MPTHSQRLIHAVRTRNYDRIRQLIEKHRDVDTRSLAGRTGLHAAAEEGDVESARILLAAKADVNARMHHGGTPLHLAAGYGGSFDLGDPDLDRADCFNRNRHWPMSKVVVEATIQILKEENPNIPSGLTPEESIPSENKGDVFAAVLESMTQPGELHRKLVARGIDVDREDPDFAEFLMGHPRYLRMVEFLLDQGADINAVDESGGTVIQSAVEMGGSEMVELLLNRGAKLSPEPVETGTTLIDSALEYCKVEVADVLLRHGASLDPKPGLHQAAANGRVTVMKWLLEHGADVNMRDELGNTPLIATGGHHEVVALLLGWQPDLRSRNLRGRGVLHESACWPKCLKLLLPLGLPLDEPDAEGTTSLHLAALGGDPIAVQMLAGAGASVNAQDHAGNTPLHKIFFSEEFRPDVEFPVFHALVASGADRSIRNNEGKTARDLAQQWSYPVEYLDLLQAEPTDRCHADNFIWLGREPYVDFQPSALVGVELDGQQWPSCEHYFHAQKTIDLEVREQMRRTATSADALCRFRDAGLKPPADWSQRCDDVMRRALSAKFQQHAPLRQKLIGTGGAVLISDSNCDWYWVERQDVGFNTIGKILMGIRKEFQIASQR